jgi:hypothetical protein
MVQRCGDVRGADITPVKPDRLRLTMFAVLRHAFATTD